MLKEILKQQVTKETYKERTPNLFWSMPKKILKQRVTKETYKNLKPKFVCNFGQWLFQLFK